MNILEAITNDPPIIPACKDCFFAALRESGGVFGSVCCTFACRETYHRMPREYCSQWIQRLPEQSSPLDEAAKQMEAVRDVP